MHRVECSCGRSASSLASAPLVSERESPVSDEMTPDPTIEALERTLASHGINVRTSEGRSALGRFAGLHLAAHAGMRDARRALHRERSCLLQTALKGVRWTKDIDDAGSSG